jgi:uncharacterized repeat protein (TIGR01451 family)
MSKLLRAVFVSLFLLPLTAFAQSADQEILSVTDSPDPAVPGDNITYTVTIRNNGPDPATNGGMNAYFPNATYVSASGPAGFTCGAFGQAASCTHPAFAAGTTAVFTLVVNLSSSLAGFPDGSISTSFSTSGTTPDPNNGNNNDSETTNYNTQQIDMAVTATDSPDPVAPGQNLTYTINVANNGPDTATNPQFSVYHVQGLTFVSKTVPAGWSCSANSVGGTINTTCSKGTMAGGETAQFTVVGAVTTAGFGVNDGTIQTQFSISGVGNETNHPNNNYVESTAYVTPDADISVAVSDSPDPVAPDGNITYTVTVANNGPDAAPSVTLSSFGSNNLHFISASTPAGWNCTLPAPNTQTPGFSCTLPTGLASGANSVLTFTLQATDEVNGVNDFTIQFGFTATAPIADPVPGNNSETESTQYSTADADISVTVSDSPDPVSPDGNITYTVTVANAGPDAAPTINLGSFGANNLRFVSATVPAGWNCTLPAAGTQTTGLNCTLPTGLASGANSVLTFVMQADDALLGFNDVTIQFGFTATSGLADPVPGNNSETESTQYVTPDADMNITASDSPDPVTPDGNITYTVTVTNQGPDTAPNAKMTIVGNGGQTRFVSITTPAGWSCATPAPGTLINVAGYDCTHPSFTSGASSVFTVVTEASDDLHPNSDHTITQNFTTTSDIADPDGTDNTAATSTLYDVPNANLVVTNSDSPDPATQGGTITYAQTITNNGGDTATNVTFNQSTPAGTTFQSFSAPGGWSCTTPAVGATGAINCSIASLANGGSGSFTLVVNVTGTGTIVSTVTGSSDANDPVPANNTATATTNVPAPITADMSITKTTTATTAPIGSTFSYTIVVTNNGPDTATNVVMTDTLPASLLFRSITQPSPFSCTTPAVGTSGTITCTAASLANGQSRTFTLVVEVAAGATGSIVNGASVTSDANDGNGGNSTATSTGVTAAPASADVSIVKSTTANQAVTGSNITYTILVSNAGPSPATNVIVTDDLPAGLTFVSATPSQGTCNAADPVSCNLGTIPSGANATITLVANVTATTGTVANTASVTSTEGGGDTSTTPSIPVVITAEFTQVPTLSEWALIALALAIAAVALRTRLS